MSNNKQGESKGRPMVAGFTLIETAIYVGLFAVLVSSVLTVFYQILRTQDQHRNRIEVDAEANFMMQKMLWGLTGASNVSQPAIGATSSVLSVNKYNFSQNPIVFNLVSGNLRIVRGTGTPVVLNNNHVSLSQLVFTHLASINSAPEAVKITISVVSSATGTQFIASTTLDNTFYLNL